MCFVWKKNPVMFIVCQKAMKGKLLVDESGDDRELWQLLLPGLRPNIVSWYVPGPVHPVPGSGPGSIFQKVLHGAQRQVTLTVGSPVPGLSPPPAGRARLFAAAQRVLAVCSAASHILLSRGHGFLLFPFLKNKVIQIMPSFLSYTRFLGRTPTSFQVNQ